MTQSQPMQVLTSHESQDWFTPPSYIELVKQVIGNIDLDPAGHHKAQEWINADMYWVVEGLRASWLVNGLPCRVFCNPPYGKNGGQSNQGIWSRKMDSEYELGHVIEGILLINSTHGYKWYEEIYNKYPCCLLKQRVRFWYIGEDGDLYEGGQAKRGQTFIYFGKNISKFVDVFKPHGRILLP